MLEDELFNTTTNYKQIVEELNDKNIEINA